MKYKILIIAICLIILARVAGVVVVDRMIYGNDFDKDSWKTMIPATCTSWFDGCNMCYREKGMITNDGREIVSQGGTCQMMGCSDYRRPHCISYE
jgi:hypothetical protein